MKQPQALIIDDNLKNVQVLARLLSNEGFNCIQVTHPSQLDAALSDVQDLRIVFLDLELPNVDGYEVLQYIRSNPNIQSVPVVAYTVHVSEINVAHQHGFDGFLGKPIDSDRFPGQLARILNGEGVWETA
jgi:two-component system, cell cycle response regulator DivK